ncbi:MAG TPA: hypothetical protein VGR24_02605 [bacterium]|nr:hypothetical protein [bacterium]
MASRVLAGSLLLLSLALTPIAAAQPAPTTVGISVPVAQALEGATTITLLPGTTRRAALVVKSNVPWVLTGRASGPPGTAAWGRAGSSPLEHLSPTGILARGEKGVHTIEVELRRTDSITGEAAAVTFGLDPR